MNMVAMKMNKNPEDVEMFICILEEVLQKMTVSDIRQMTAEDEDIFKQMEVPIDIFNQMKFLMQET